jgi:hypothetical protein
MPAAKSVVDPRYPTQRDARRERAERGWALGREREQPRLVSCIDVRGREGRSLLEQHVRIGAAHAEPAHAGHARQRARGPRAVSVGDREARPAEREVRVRRREVHLPRDLAMPQDQRRLDETRDAGGRLEVSEVRLDGAEVAAAVVRARRADRRRQRLDFDRIAQRRARAVCLDESDAVRREQRVA